MPILMAAAFAVILLVVIVGDVVTLLPWILGGALLVVLVSVIVDAFAEDPESEPKQPPVGSMACYLQKALAVVAARLAERAWIVMHRGTHHQVPDPDNTPITLEQAKDLIAARYTVPEEVRRQRRSRKKGGRAPHQVLEGRVSSQRSKRDDTRRPSQTEASPTPAAASTPAAT